MNRQLTWMFAVSAPLLLPTVGLAAEVAVSSAEEIARAAASAKPGDVLVMRDGQWKDQAIHFHANGTDAQPITLRAQTPGKVVLCGNSSLAVDGQYGVVSGLSFKDATAAGDGIAIRGEHHRLTDTAIVGGTYKLDVHLYGHHQRVDHCYFAEKASENPTFQIEVDKDRPDYDQVDHNHFGHRPPLGKNGGETMRVGYSWQSQWNSRATVEHNLFERCDGEIEIISSKSCENVYRYNTFLDCGGFLTLRHGHRCVVDSNFFIAHHKAGSGGIRVINEGHRITNNYIEGVEKGGFWITAGIKDGPLTGYTRAKDCVIAFNTVVDFAGPGFELAAGLGTANRTLVPEDVTIANNLLSPGKGGMLVKGMQGRYTWIGNVAAVDPKDVDGQRFAAPKVTLERGEDGLLHLSAPVAAAGDFADVKTDIDGQPRGESPDVGCDQWSRAPATNRPLTPADVGPSWMKSGASAGAAGSSD